MIMIMDNGKMNPLGRPEYWAVMRHRNPLLCTIAHTALPLYRWNVAGETPPCFRQRQQWYGLHLIKDEHAARQMAYDTQLDWINRMFTGAGVTSLKKDPRARGQTRRAEWRQRGPDPFLGHHV
jgi:Centromere DNA-binding protein complex CBF3 subunit, domain 2